MTGKKLSDEEWQAIRWEYENTPTTSRSLGRAHDVSAARICQVAKARGWIKFDPRMKPDWEKRLPNKPGYNPERPSPLTGEVLRPTRITEGKITFSGTREEVDELIERQRQQATTIAQLCDNAVESLDNSAIEMAKNAIAAMVMLHKHEWRLYGVHGKDGNPTVVGSPSKSAASRPSLEQFNIDELFTMRKIAESLAKRRRSEPAPG